MSTYATCGFGRRVRDRCRSGAHNSPSRARSKRSTSSARAKQLCRIGRAAIRKNSRRNFAPLIRGGVLNGAAANSCNLQSAKARKQTSVLHRDRALKIERHDGNVLLRKIRDVLETLTSASAGARQRFGVVDGYSRTLEEVGRKFRGRVSG